ncbi:MAG: sodium/proline symporter PutP [Peptococcaceae bacterium]|nr:sodium/proline symporter PutP [Peptococcaceae bacterium]
MSEQEMMILGAMIAYLVMIVIVGLAFSKKNKTSEEFYLGGRGMGPWITAMSAEASDMSGWLLMGLPGAAYLMGLSSEGWTAIGLALGTYLNWRFTAVPLRIYTHIADNSITIPDYLSNRFHDRKKILMNLAALFFFIFFIAYAAAGFNACGKVFESLFGFNYQASMMVSAFVIVIYTVVGGFLAESTVDFIQGILMFFALIFIVCVALVKADGFSGVTAFTDTVPGFFSLFDAGGTFAGGVIKTLSGLAWGLGYFGMPHVLLRFMAIRDASELKKSRRIGTSWVIISLGMALCIGVVGRALYPDLLHTSSEAETIFVVLCEDLMQGGLLPIIGGIMLSGILAAQISSSDSQLLVASSAISQNFYKGLLKPNASEKQVLWVSRLTIIIIAVVAAVLALNPESSVFDVVSLAWAGLGATFGPLILFSLYWKRTNLWGAVAGMISGGGMVLIWKYLLKPLGGFFSLYELLPAFLISGLAIVLVSLATPEPAASVYAEFEEYKAQLAKH